jgi:Fusaric acid resistance protein-like
VGRALVKNSFSTAAGVACLVLAKSSMNFATPSERVGPASTGATWELAASPSLEIKIARLVQMPEAYWAAIATLVVMQSTLGATLTLSVERILATAVGASAGALEAKLF